MRSTPVYAERDEPGATIRQPSVALLCVDSEDKYDQARDAALGTNSHTLRVADETPYNTLIYKNGPLMAGKICRIALTEFNMNWSVPTITPNNNSLTLLPGFLARYTGYGLTANNGPAVTIKLNTGFYTMAQLASALTAGFAGTLGFNNKFETTANPANGNIDIVTLDADTLNFVITLNPKLVYQASTAAPITLAPVQGAPITFTIDAGKSFTAGDVVTVYRKNVAISGGAQYFFGIVSAYNNVTGVITLNNVQGITGSSWGNPMADGCAVVLTAAPILVQNELTNMMGFDGPNLLSQTWLDETDIPPSLGLTYWKDLPPQTLVGDFARMTYTPYIDIVSARLTKNQEVYDNSSSLTNPIRSLLARIYLTPDGVVARDDPDLVLGCKPFTINKLYNVPKQIAWEPTENIDSIDLRVLDWKGRVLYSLPTVTVSAGLNLPSIIEVGNTASYQMTLQISEN